MAYLEENEWMILNEIGYNVSSIYDINALYKNIFDWLGLLISYDCGSFALVRKEKEHYNTHFELEIVETRNIPERYIKVWQNEVKRSNTTNSIIFSAREKAYRVSDFIADSKMVTNSIYKAFYEPQELFYSMGICIVFDEEPIALLQMYRRKEEHDFEERDLFILNQLQKHLAYRMSYEFRKGNLKYFYAGAYQEELSKKYDLTEKERKVFDYAVEGLTNLEIAEKMNVSIHTVKKHFYNLYTKMNVNNRIQLLQGIPKKNDDKQ